MKKRLRVGSDFTGTGAADEALNRLGVDQEKVFACDVDKFVRRSYILNRGTKEDIELLETGGCKFVDDVFYKLFVDLKGKRPTEEEKKKAFDLSKKISKQFSFYYPWSVYEREIPEKPLDIYVTTPPCQSFSLAGNRGGESDERGVLFYNSLDFIRKNNPYSFVFENVKGLMSDDQGRTFGKWIDLLGGKSVNGSLIMFPHENSVPYHIYYKVINSTDFNVPQNRERVFIVGIRDDKCNVFRWPKSVPLVKRLKDVLEQDVHEKYFLSDNMINYLFTRKDNFNDGKINFKEESDIASCINASSGFDKSDNILKIGFINQDTQASQVIDEEGVSASLCAGTHGYAQGYVRVKSATKCGYELATLGDSINLSVPNSETRRGRVGKEVAQTLDTACNQAVLIQKEYTKGNPQGAIVCETNGVSCTISACGGGLGAKTELYEAGYRIRRLTPRECARLMYYPDSYKIVVSDTQAYKQAGNGVVVACFENIFDKIINTCLNEKM